MKRTILSLGMVLLFAFASDAQVVSITGFGGYTFQDKVKFSNAYGYMLAGGHWGFSLEGMNQEGHALELLYQQQNTHIPLYYYAFPDAQINPDKDDIAISYIMLNGLHYLQASPGFWPYGGLGFGAAVIKDKSYDDSQTKFAWDVKLGVKIKPTPAVGIKIQAQLFSVIQAGGGGFYAGTGGADVGVTSYATIYQFAFTGGICIDFERSH